MHHRRVFIAVVIAVVIVVVVVRWVQLRQAEDAAVAALTADLTATTAEIDEAIAASADPPSPAELRRMIALLRKSDDLSKRMNEISPKLRSENSAAYQAAQERFLQSLQRLATRMERAADPINGG